MAKTAISSAMGVGKSRKASELRRKLPGGPSALLVDPLGFDAGDSNLYRYLKNAPVQGTDPSGLDVIVLGRTSAWPYFGHAAVLVGNDRTGWDYFSFEDRNPPIKPIHFANLNAAINSNQVKCEGRDYENYAYFRTFAVDDQAARNVVNALNKTSFHALTNNCQTAAVKILCAAIGDERFLADIEPFSPLETVANLQKKAWLRGRWKIDAIVLPPNSRAPGGKNPSLYPGNAPRYNHPFPSYGASGFYPGNVPKR